MSSNGPDRGSQFTFWIPHDEEMTISTGLLDTHAEQMTREQEIKSRQLGGIPQKILLVEDNPVNQLVIK